MSSTQVPKIGPASTAWRCDPDTRRRARDPRCLQKMDFGHLSGVGFRVEGLGSSALDGSDLSPAPRRQKNFRWHEGIDKPFGQ